MSKLAHSNDETMLQIDARTAVENGVAIEVIQEELENIKQWSGCESGIFRIEESVNVIRAILKEMSQNNS